MWIFICKCHNDFFVSTPCVFYRFLPFWQLQPSQMHCSTQVNFQFIHSQLTDILCNPFKFRCAMNHNSHCVQLCQNWLVFVFAMHLHCFINLTTKKSTKILLLQELSHMSCQPSYSNCLYFMVVYSVPFWTLENKLDQDTAPENFQPEIQPVLSCSTLFRPDISFLQSFFIFNFHTLTPLLRLK